MPVAVPPYWESRQTICAVVVFVERSVHFSSHGEPDVTRRPRVAGARPRRSTRIVVTVGLRFQSAGIIIGEDRCKGFF